MNNLLESIIDSAKNGKFSEFEDTVKDILKQKLKDNEQIKKYEDDFDKIQGMKDIFTKISKQSKDDTRDDDDNTGNAGDDNENGSPTSDSISKKSNEDE
jgi:hypothetical protein